MTRFFVGHHLVVTRANRVVGVLSNRDAGGGRGAVVSDNHVVADLMSAAAVTVEPATTVRVEGGGPGLVRREGFR